ncbi:MAG TPA: cation-translocating P-type ATPase [Chlamydiales bacterium]|nr:cation-translocating P-type ATPase [Chlamydiales bacterium]
MTTPYLFDEFFDSGMEESISPFLTKQSRAWGKNNPLRSAIAAAVLFAFAFGFSFFYPSLSYLLQSLVFFLVGVPAFIAAIDDIKNFEINIDVLMTVAAFFAVLIGSSIEGALLLVLFSLSHAMEDSVSKKARSALHNLNHITPKFASLIDQNGAIFEKSVKEVTIGEIVIVKNGEFIPLDGKIVRGTSSLNLSHLTGESLPVIKTIGDHVPAGGKNLESVLYIEVTRISADSTVSKIIQLIVAAHDAKPKLQSFLDRFGKYYASTIIVLTFVFACSLPMLFSLPYFGTEGAIYRALAFLIAASPCALIIATPTAYLSAISACARKGILLKGGITLDALASCSIIAFDKTGTLTTGELICSKITTFQTSDIEKAISIAYGLEQHVVHPIAKAIGSLSIERKLPAAHISELQTVPGSGLEGLCEGKHVAIGRPEYIASKLSDSTRFNEWIASHKETSHVLTILLIEKEIFLFQFTDSIRKDAAKLIQRVQTTNHLRPVMLTGDHASSANHIGQILGIPEIYSDLRPEHKLGKVAELAKVGNLAMVGDGINDAPALARASVGISMGRVGSATAIDASDVVLLNDDIHLVSWIFSKSHHTRRIVKQNLSLALGVICLATIPALLGLVPLWAAVIMHEGGTVLVGLNSLRLFR